MEILAKGIMFQIMRMMSWRVSSYLGTNKRKWIIDMKGTSKESIKKIAADAYSALEADFMTALNQIARGFDIPAKPVIHGDAISPSIAAASILAKVTRDRKCIEWDAMYPQYKIAKHKGYGTKDHMAALREFGPSPIHRKKFIRFLDED